MVQSTTGLRITRIKNQRTGAKNADEEWISIVNEGSTSWQIAGWEVTDQTATQQRPHIYRFPDRLGNGEGWRFDPGEVIFLFTGKGTDTFIATPSDGGKPQFHFHWGRDAFVWNNSGDRVYLRRPNGEFATEPYPVP